ncbi:MAG: 60S ribosomal export protein NMD3 [Candidatus Diapherotrites archaeon]|nr:60S ribosomal export protein NMD3 [Candidatus Diapherotrites archaeon]
MKAFCPSCGVKEGEKEFIDGFCIDCYLKDHELFKIPEEIEIEICSNCQKFRFGKQWIDYTDENIEKLIVSKAESNMDIDDLKVGIYPEEKNVLVKLQIKGRKNEIPLTIRKEIYLKERKVNCPACSRLNGGYFEATLQIRFDKMQRDKERKALLQMHEILNSEREKGDHLAQVIKLEEKKDGFDVQLGSKKAARKISREFTKRYNGKVTFSSSIVTEKKGTPVYRDTFCVRMP